MSINLDYTLILIKYTASFITLFSVILICLNQYNNLICAFTDNNYISFTILYLPIIFFCQTKYDIIWFMLAYAHGIAHIIDPAFYGVKYNESYSPFGDYLVHAAQCLTMFLFHRNNLPMKIIGLWFFTTIMVGGAMGHLEMTFMNTTLWVFLSGGGIFGTIYHMMLLNKSKYSESNETHQMIINLKLGSNIIFWVAPYLGYIIPRLIFSYSPWTIPQWDLWMNQIGLFRIWFMCYFFTHKIYDHIFF